MLKNKTKSIALGANSYIGDIPVMQLSANISSSTGVGSVNQYVQNAEVYNANKTVVRRDITEFQNDVYAEEDAMIVDAPLEEATTEQTT